MELRKWKILSLIRKTNRPTGKLKLNEKNSKRQRKYRTWSGNLKTLSLSPFPKMQMSCPSWNTGLFRGPVIGRRSVLERCIWVSVSGFLPSVLALSFVPLERRKGHVAHTWHKLAEGFAFCPTGPNPISFSYPFLHHSAH